MADGGGDDDGVDDVRCSGGGTGPARGAARAVVVGNDVAAFQDARDLVLGSAAPGLGQDDDGDEGADAGGGELVVQREEVRVAALCGQERAGVVDDGLHQLAVGCGSASRAPASASQAEACFPSSAAAALMVFSTSAGTDIDSFRAVMRSC